MANAEQRAKLKGGVEAWNAWRKANPRAEVDLSCANLRGANLNRANLIRADLSGADLIRARLTWADLREADLALANLGGAKLSWANLSGANLGGADLSRTDLSEANLSGANLSGVSLRYVYWLHVDARNADFSEAKLSGFRPAYCNFSGAKCSRADYSESGKEPEWCEFADGEFARWYGTLFGVEVLFDPKTPIEFLGELMAMLNRRCEGAQFDELRRRVRGFSALWRAKEEDVEEVAEAIAECLEHIRCALRFPAGEGTEAILELETEASLRKIEAMRAQGIQDFAPQVVIIKGDARITVADTYNEGGSMNIRKVKGKQVVVAEQLLGQGIVNMVGDVNKEGDVAGALEQLEEQFAKAAEDDREAFVQAVRDAIPEDKLAWWKQCAANLVGSGAAGGLVTALAKLLG